MCDHIRVLFLKIENNKVWSNPDLPIEVRAPDILLFTVTILMASEGWGYTREKLWVNKTKKTLSYGKEFVLGVSMEGLDMKLDFGTLWEAHLSGDVAFKQLVKNVIDKLVERPSKGDGKGKPGKAGKLTASA